MNKLLTAIAVFVLGSVFTAAAQHHDRPAHDSGTIAGNWQFSIDTRHGKLAGVLKLNQEGSKLSGVCEIEGHGSNPVTGTLDGKKVALNLSVQDGQMKLKLSGSVDGAKMSGSSDEHGMTWTATRPK